MRSTYVVDASVVLKWFLPEPDVAAADLLMEKFLNDEAELVAPDLVLVEAASALWKRVTLRHELSADEALLVYRDLRTLPLTLVPVVDLIQSALQFATSFHHSVYDSIYCVLARDHGCDLITADRTLVNKISGVFPFVRHLSTIKS